MNRTSFLDCKHKHMMKRGAPSDKFGVHVPYVYQSNSMVSQAKLILRVITLWFLVLSQLFLETVWVPLKGFSQLDTEHIIPSYDARSVCCQGIPYIQRFC